ncbi:MAG: NTP transferase domain-containing protein [Candidatus Muirbacterium halophilum]|nr:NTP transferase domain-containing protein [Candidatus Muirbacterium halophilum]MCK9475189.1 NTP transferase domain-containing protein [Candidatus Muirbacterium halophilum]
MGKINFYGIVIAAGYSSRFKSIKALAEWEKSNFIKTIIKKLNSICSSTVVITGFEANLISENIKNISNTKTIFNKNYPAGMITSIVKGFEYYSNIKENDYIVFQPVDIPGININTYENMKDIALKQKSYIIKPSYNMKCGHPVFFQKKVIDQILKLHYSNNDMSLKSLIDKFQDYITYFNCNDENILKNYNYSDGLNL